MLLHTRDLRDGETQWSVLVVLAALSMLWVMLVFHIIRFGAHY